jgi:hypothetical protein
MPVSDPYKAELRDALVGAVATKLARERRRAVMRRVAFAAVVLAALVGAFVTVTLPNDRAEARIDVEVHDGSVSVRLLDFENRPDEIVGALRNAGIDASVKEVPVGPSNVGRFVGYSSPTGATLTISDGGRFSFLAFSVSQGFSGVLQLSLGRAAASGEQWAVTSDATAKGEALACRDLRSLTAREASSRVAGAHATVSWLAIPGGTLAPGAELAEPYANWRVVDVLSPDANVVVMHLTADGSWPYLTQPPPAIDPSCKGK